MMKHLLPLTLIASLRFFGLFIVLPIIGLYADEFHTTAFLAGLAAGGYALTQIIFQTPFGILSDKYNRKHIIGIGLLIFLLGSLVCAFANDITMLIIGRFLQGVGAIGGVVSAQVADLVREEERNKAMAVMGAGIFMSFVLAMFLSPIIASHFGSNMLFLITSVLCVFSLIVLYWKVPNTPNVKYHFNDNKIHNLLTDKNLLIMYLSAFLQKFLMILTFVCVSFALIHHFLLDEDELWLIYTPAAIIGTLAMGPASIFAQKKGQFKAVMLFGICAFVLSYFLMAYAVKESEKWLILLMMIVFFMGFAVLEPIMQSLASRYPKAHQKGAALGIFTTLGYVGSALGGMCGGWLYEAVGVFNLSLIVAVMCIIWAILLILFLSNPKNHKNVYLKLEGNIASRLNKLDTLQGIIEWYINQNEHIAIIKYDATLIQEAAILSVFKGA